MSPSSDCSIGKQSTVLDFLTPVVGDEDRLPQQMLLRGRYHHRAAGVGGHVQFFDAQRINRERVAMRVTSFLWAGAVIGIVSEIGAALLSPGRQNGAMLCAGALGKFVN